MASIPRQLQARISTSSQGTVSAVRFRPQPLPRKTRGSVTRSVTKSSKKSARINLGLALLRVANEHGSPLDCQDIASWCGCSWQNIHQIEQRALRRLRNRLIFLGDLRLREAAEHLMGRALPFPAGREATWRR